MSTFQTRFLVPVPAQSYVMPKKCQIAEEPRESNSLSARGVLLLKTNFIDCHSSFVNGHFFLHDSTLNVHI